MKSILRILTTIAILITIAVGATSCARKVTVVNEEVKVYTVKEYEADSTGTVPPPPMVLKCKKLDSVKGIPPMPPTKYMCGNVK